MTSIQDLEKQLKDRADIDARSLAVLGIGAGEQLIGEVLRRPEVLVGRGLSIKNPKRFMRLQNVTPRGIAVQFVLGDLDMVESGCIQVFASYGYYLSSLELPSRGSMLELVLDYVRRRSMAESGLVLPESSIVGPKE